MTPEPTATTTARALVAALIQHGVGHVVLSPGSRSAPLAYALAAAVEAGDLEVHVRIDERVGAFTALGLARFGPAAVVTTSGTAAANLHPALLEARHSDLGLIAITADRPHEMRGVGANQTTNQMHMFGPHIHAVEIPAGAAPASVANQMARIIARTAGAFGPPEPVHLNIAFRDPLVPAGEAPAPVPAPVGPRLRLPQLRPEPVAIDVSRPTVVVAGDGAGERAAQFAAEARLPLLAEPSSGARAGDTAIGPYQRLLPTLGEEVAQVIVFGRPTLSRPVSGLLARAPQVTVVADSPQWVDVSGNADQVVGDVTAETSDGSWLTRWQEAAAQVPVRDTLAADVVGRALSEGQPQVMIGSSMAIRHADIHAPVGVSYTRAPVWAGRGLAGIDGTIATATGIALVAGPLRVLVGDLTFAHDVGALALGPAERAPQVQIVVLNDGGGGIFGMLEHGEPQYAATFPRFFATPVELRVEEIAAAYGYDYHGVETSAQATDLVAQPIAGRSIVEVHLPAITENSQKTLRNPHDSTQVDGVNW